MRPSQNCFNIIKQSENEPLYLGLIKLAYPERDKLNPRIIQIGYGMTYYPDNTSVTLKDKPITELEASAMLYQLVDRFAKYVSAQVKSIINQNQFDALVSFTYNEGQTAFKTSTLLKKVNANPFDKSIEAELDRWIYSNKVKVKGLQKRRAKESALYFSQYGCFIPAKAAQQSK